MWKCFFGRQPWHAANNAEIAVIVWLHIKSKENYVYDYSNFVILSTEELQANLVRIVTSLRADVSNSTLNMDVCRRMQKHLNLLLTKDHRGFLLMSQYADCERQTTTLPTHFVLNIAHAPFVALRRSSSPSSHSHLW